MFLLDFDQPVTTNGSALPTAWWGAVWEGDNTTSFMSAMSTKPATYITAGNSLGGFSFTVDQQVGEVPFHAEFIDTDSFDGTTVVPEPLSMILFAAGGGTMALRYRMRRKK
jgi:hypothetical protein